MFHSMFLGIHRRQKMPQRLRCQGFGTEKGQAGQVLFFKTNQTLIISSYLIILFHESSMKFATNIVLKLVNPILMVVLNEKTIQHRFKIVSPQPQPASKPSHVLEASRAMHVEGHQSLPFFATGELSILDFQMGTNEGNRT